MTKIIFSFDTEDFTCKEAADAIVKEANILKDEGVRGCFCVVGALATQLVDWGKTDVIDALKPHEIDLHSLTHSMHPLINEYTDKEDFFKVKEELLRQERFAEKCVLETFSREKIFAAVPPGNQDSYVAMHGYAEMGVPIYADSICDPTGNGIYYCNAFHLAYVSCLEDYLFWNIPFRIKKELDRLAQNDIAVIYTHPHKAMYAESWDVLNFDKENLREYNNWIIPDRKKPAMTARFYKNMRKMVRMLKRDKRFTFTTYEEIAKEYMPGKERTLSVNQVPALYNTLKEGLMPCKSPSLSLCDMFFSCADFLQGKRTHVCGRVYGPMEEPKGIEYPVTLLKKEVFESAKTIDPSLPVPSRIRVGQYYVGPADWLYAAVEALYGVGEIELVPTPQLPDLTDLPKIKNCSFKGTWRHSDSFQDRFLSDRLRYQSWTMRYPD